MLTGAWQSGAYLAGNDLADTAIENDEIGVALLSTPSNDDPYVVGSIDHGWAINKNSSNKEAAMKVLDECATGEAAQIWLDELYGIPCSPDVTVSADAIKTEEGKNTIGIITDTLETRLAGPRSTGNATVDNKIGEMVQAFVQGMTDAESAVSEIQTAYESSK